MSPLLFSAALLASSTVLAQPVVVSDVKLVYDGQEIGQTTAFISGGQLMLPLTAAAQMGWKPLLDTENHIVDLAGCLRVSTTQPKMWAIGSPPSLGVHQASALARLPVSAEFRGGRWYIPAKAVAGQLLYTVTFDKASSRVDIKKPTDPAKINPNVEACLRNIEGK